MSIILIPHLSAMVPSVLISRALARLLRSIWHRYTHTFFAAILLLYRSDVLVFSSIHEVHESLTGCKMTEIMFADGRGPWGIAGISSVSADVTLRSLTDAEVHNDITVRRLSDYFDFAIVLATYTTETALAVGFDERVACSWNYSNTRHLDGKLQGELLPLENDKMVQLSTTFYPKEEGLQTVILVPCWKQKSSAFGYPVSAEKFVMYRMVDPLLRVNAKIAFRNPYGYLPGLLFGQFAFNCVTHYSGILSLEYLALDVFFLILMYRHRGSVVGTHYFLLTILLLSTCESVAWFVAYNLLNASGVPICCPYPDLVLFSTFIKVLAGMVARIATTLVSLGYGIVRMQISWPEVFVVSGLGVCYFIAVGALEISHLANQSDGEVRPPVVWEALVTMTNLCFGGWIYMSLALTRKNLADFGQVESLKLMPLTQTAKVQIYASLNQILVTYALISVCLMITEGAIYANVVSVPWTYLWIVSAASRQTFFGVLLVAVYLWRPTKHGLLYSQMDQLPSREPVMTHSIAHGIEQISRVTSAADDDNSPPSSRTPVTVLSTKGSASSTIE
ncbi:hypothetical protein CCR75_002084 [Bremia lactucae]|uniref:GOST seven transmembrane domain-containing protein n=1 Tax=Bremia lactucae TaxID=4779 RepID=A0A976IKT4_BRELC|nr:hypothetical protein CCR75_002084 [Bremia lactucae]